MLAWTPDDLRVISDEYLSTVEYQNLAPEDLRRLLDKYEVLGREIGDLSQILERSGRQPKTYRDPNLERHIREAKQDLKEHFREDRVASALLRRSPLKTLSSSKIAKFYQQADEHVKDVRDFKIGFLLDTELDALFAKDSGNANRDATLFTSSDFRSLHLGTSPLRQVQSASSSLQVPPTKEHNTGNLVDDASGALRLARVVWKNMADMSSHNRERHRPSSGHITAKQQYVLDVAELIKRAELYAAGIDALDEQSRHALEEIVSKAVQLRDARLSPIVPVLVRDLNERRLSSGTVPMPRRLVDEDGIAQRHVSLTGDWLPYTPLQLPESAISDSGMDWTSTGDAVQAEANVHAMAPHDIVFAATTVTSSKARRTNTFVDDSSSPWHSAYGMRDNTNDMDHMQAFAELDLKGWVKISSRQLRLPPTICTLSVDELEGGVHIQAALLPRSSISSSYAGSDTSGRSGSIAPSLGSVSSRESNSAYTHKFKHILRSDSRSIPTVKHPKYEGLEMSPQEPYTITFGEAQLVAEEGSQRQFVQDLKYVFSEKEYRDQVRAMMFGKTLLASSGVAKISFDQIACTRQSVSLWGDKHTGRKTMTFLRTNPDPKREVEYEIIGIEESKRSAKDEDPIVLYVELLSPRTKRQRCSLYFSDISGKQEFFKVLHPS